MLANYIKIALRHIIGDKFYSSVHIIGLATGIACCALALLVITHELAYDRFHLKAERIYRVLRERSGGSETQVRWLSSGALARALENEFGQVELATKCRIYPVRARYGAHTFENVVQGQVDENFFRVFDFTLLDGDPHSALNRPYTALITETTARRIFGAENPLGKVLTLSERYYGGDYVITGILKDPPDQASSLQFDLLHATRGRDEAAQTDWTTWQGRIQQAGIQTFALLDDNRSLPHLEAQLPDFIERHMGREVREVLRYRLQPLKRMHLYARQDYGLDEGGDIRSLYLFAAVALLVLAIVCINFVNLSTARAATRAHEIGVRKALGAERTQLIAQFLGESLLYAAISLVAALALVALVLPEFNALLGGDFHLDGPTLLRLAPSLVLLAILTGIAAGLYPAFYLSSFAPSRALKGRLAHAHQSWLRRVLVAGQFAISILLITGTIAVHRQIEYINDKELGFAREHFVLLPIFAQQRDHSEEGDEWLSGRYNAVKQAFLAHPNVRAATAFRFLPGHSGGMVRLVKPEGHDDGEWHMPIQEADESFFAAFAIDLLTGRTFSPANERDRTHSYILNEKAVRALGWTVEDAVGRRFGRARSAEDAEGTVIGVVRDFNYASLREPIGPAAIAYRQWFYSYLGLRISGENTAETLAFLQEQWQHFMSADQPFTYSFLDQEIEATYRAEERLRHTIAIFSLLAILLASLGLFGLVSFSAQQRTREIGIRKVLGASSLQIALLLSRDFIALIAIANLVTWPLANYIIESWLEGFAYRIDMAWWIFALGGFSTLVIACCITSYQAFKAARTNPVEALRHE